ncbi:MAG TPA: glycosyltransferase family 39 protein, partial [Chloroflexia bacterium]|nr:glycosyltransferase family 39 protein [Chloroflexia bacterium]
MARRLDPRVLLGVVVLLGAAARCWNLDWDQGAYSLHPDEWALNQVVRRLGPDGNPHFFFYGSLPIYLDRGTAWLLGWLTGQDWLATERVALIGRAYSAVASTLLLPLVFLVGRRLWGTTAGLRAAAFTAAAALLIQAAHFGTVDTAVTLAGVALCWTALRIAEGGGRKFYLLGGMILGLAIATKLTAASFVLFLVLAHFQRPPAERTPGPLLWSGIVALGTTLLAAPYYVLAWPELWAAIREQSRELGGGYTLAYTWQFRQAVPYLFELQNL